MLLRDQRMVSVHPSRHTEVLVDIGPGEQRLPTSLVTGPSSFLSCVRRGQSFGYVVDLHLATS